MKIELKQILFKSIIALGLILILLSPFLHSNPISASGESWLSGYDKRKQITVTGSADGAQSNYQVRFNIYKTTGADSGSDVYLGSDVRDDFTDVRFTASDGVTLLDFWTESYTSGTSATVWVEFPTIGANPNTVTAYLYYGLAYSPETSSNSTITNSGLKINKHNVQAPSDNLWSFNGNQYAAYVDSSGNVIVAKRTLPSGEWATQDTGINADTSDGHEMAYLGIDPDGYIHIAAGFHNDPIGATKYIISNSPEDISAWTGQASMTGSDENSVSYINFFNCGGYLYCWYRNGASGNGEIYLNKYDHNTATWSAVQHPLINTVAATKSAYPNFTVDSVGNIQVSWVWRDTTSSGSNHDLCYAKSTDGGTTWKKSNGSSYTLPITYAASDIVDPVAVGDWLFNTPPIITDSSNRPHIVYIKADSNDYLNYFHAYYNGSTWIINQITNFTLSKAGDFDTSLGVPYPSPLMQTTTATDGTDIMAFFTYGGRFITAKASFPYTSWEFHQIGSDTWTYIECNYDKNRWASSGILDFLMSNPDMTAGSVPIYVVSTTPSTWTHNYTYASFFGLSNGDATFSFFDTFPGNQMDSTDWYHLHAYGTTTVASSSVAMKGTTTQYEMWGGKTVFGVNYAARGRAYIDSESGWNGTAPWFEWNDSSNDGSAVGSGADGAGFFLNGSPVSKYYRTTKEGTTTSDARADAITSYSVVEVQRNASTNVKILLNGTLKDTITTNIPTDDCGILGGLKNLSGSAWLHWDWVLVRKYTVNEPTVTAWATEEDEPTPYYPPDTPWTLVVRYEPTTIINGTTLPDRAGTAQNGVITWGTNPAGISFDITTEVPAATATPSSGSTITGPATDPTQPANMYDTNTTGGGMGHISLPGADVINALLDAGGIPYAIFWLPIILTLQLIASYYSFKFAPSLLIKTGSNLALIVFWCATGVFGLWFAFFWLIPAIAIMLKSQVFGY